MTRNLCNLWGHRRDKRRATRYADTWRSYCTQCGIMLERIGTRRWIPLAGDMAPSRDKPRTRIGTYPAPPSLQIIGQKTSPAPQRLVPANIRFTAATRSASPADERGYYSARAIEARSLAEGAADRSIALIHLDMAMRYDLLARLEADEPQQLQAKR